MAAIRYSAIFCCSLSLSLFLLKLVAIRLNKYRCGFSPPPLRLPLSTHPPSRCVSAQVQQIKQPARCGLPAKWLTHGLPTRQHASSRLSPESNYVPHSSTSPSPLAISITVTAVCLRPFEIKLLQLAACQLSLVALGTRLPTCLQRVAPILCHRILGSQ